MGFKVKDILKFCLPELDLVLLLGLKDRARLLGQLSCKNLFAALCQWYGVASCSQLSDSCGISDLGKVLVNTSGSLRWALQQ